jgi:hypothetical protein
MIRDHKRHSRSGISLLFCYRVYRNAHLRLFFCRRAETELHSVHLVEFINSPGSLFFLFLFCVNSISGGNCGEGRAKTSMSMIRGTFTSPRLPDQKHFFLPSSRPPSPRLNRELMVLYHLLCMEFLFALCFVFAFPPLFATWTINIIHCSVLRFYPRIVR